MLCEIASASGSGDASLTSRTTTRVAVAAGPDMHMNCKLPNQRRLPQATHRLNHHALRFSNSNRTLPAFQRWDRSCLGRSRPSSGGVAGPDLRTRTSVFSCSGHFLPGLKAPEHVPGRPVRFTRLGVTHITLPISRNYEFESHDVPTRPIAAATNSKILETTDTATITVQMQKSRINFTRQSLPSTNRRPTVQFSKSTVPKTHIRLLLCNIKSISRKFDSNFRTDVKTQVGFLGWAGSGMTRVTHAAAWCRSTCPASSATPCPGSSPPEQVEFRRQTGDQSDSTSKSTRGELPRAQSKVKLIRIHNRIQTSPTTREQS